MWFLGQRAGTVQVFGACCLGPLQSLDQFTHSLWVCTSSYFLVTSLSLSIVNLFNLCYFVRWKQFLIVELPAFLQFSSQARAICIAQVKILGPHDITFCHNPSAAPVCVTLKIYSRIWSLLIVLLMLSPMSEWPSLLHGCRDLLTVLSAAAFVSLQNSFEHCILNNSNHNTPPVVSRLTLSHN